MSSSKQRKKIDLVGIDPDWVYSMKLPHLGHAVIINNLGGEFSGTKVDVDALEETLSTIGFTVHVHSDCTKQEMWKVRSKITREEEHHQSNCFLMVVLCHGNKRGKLYDMYGNEAFCMDQLIEEVAATKSLNGKPKLFFFDSCRGDEENYGNRGKPTPDNKQDRGPNSTKIIWPDLTDVWVAYPTMPGYQAYGGDDDGSIYQQALAKCLLEKFRTHDLSAIHRMVKQIMARDTQGDNSVQTAEERNGLRYLLKFGDFHEPVSLIQQPSDSLDDSSLSVPSESVLKTKKETTLDRNLARMNTNRTEPLFNNRTNTTQVDLLISNENHVPVPSIKTKWQKSVTLPTKGKVHRLRVSPDGENFATVEKSADNKWMLGTYKLTTGGLVKNKAIQMLCCHDSIKRPAIYPVISHNQLKLFFFCLSCRNYFIYDWHSLQTKTPLIERLHTPLAIPSSCNVCSGGSNTIIFNWCDGDTNCVAVDDCVTGKRISFLQQFPLHHKIIATMCFVPSKQMIVATSRKQNDVLAVSSDTGRTLWSVKLTSPGRVVYLPDHDAVVVKTSSELFVMNPQNGLIKQSIPLPPGIKVMGRVFPCKSGIAVTHNTNVTFIDINCS